MKRSLSCVVFFILSAAVFCEKITIASSVDNSFNPLFTKIYEEAGFEVELLVVPQKRMILMIDNGEACTTITSDAVITNLLKTKAVKIGFGDKPLETRNVSAYVRSKDRKSLGDASLWPSKVIGIIAGNDVSRQYAERIQPKKMIEAPTYETAVSMLNAGRIDMLFVTSGLLEPLIDSKKLDITYLEKPVGTVGLWHVIPAKYAGTDVERRIRQTVEKNRRLIEDEFRD